MWTQLHGKMFVYIHTILSIFTSHILNVVFSALIHRLSRFLYLSLLLIQRLHVSMYTQMCFCNFLKFTLLLFFYFFFRTHQNYVMYTTMYLY